MIEILGAVALLLVVLLLMVWRELRKYRKAAVSSLPSNDLRDLVRAMSGEAEHDREAEEYAAGYGAARQGVPEDGRRDRSSTVFWGLGWRAFHEDREKEA